MFLFIYRITSRVFHKDGCKRAEYKAICFNILQRLQYIFVKYHKDIKIFVKICFSTGKVLIFCALRTRKLKALIKTENRNVK